MKFHLGAGYNQDGQVLSGSERGNEKNRPFAPQYGTNYLFNGYMDYFFAGVAFENSVGLIDLFLRARYDFGPQVFMQADAHRQASVRPRQYSRYRQIPGHGGRYFAG